MKQILEPAHLLGQLPLTRRRFLLLLATRVPLIGLAMPMTVPGLGAEHAETADNTAFLNASRVITGDAMLSAGVARRIMALLTVRIAGFALKLDDLVTSFEATGGAREQMLSALADGQVKFALTIARPWYLGYVGNPSDFVLKDDAVFATYLEAQGWSKIVHEVPRPTYPGADAGWWDVAPPGVNAPAMPEGITRWTFHPGGPARILAPDPKWKAYAMAAHSSIDAALNAKP